MKPGPRPCVPETSRIQSPHRDRIAANATAAAITAEPLVILDTLGPDLDAVTQLVLTAQPLPGKARSSPAADHQTPQYIDHML
jgi:hypothetical protein